MQIPPDQIAAVRLLESDIRLPPSASEVWVYESRFQDADQLLRFDSSLDDARSFSRAVLERPAMPGEDPHFTYLGQGRDWWIREYPAGAEGGVVNRPGAHRKLVLVPMGGRARIWLSISGR